MKFSTIFSAISCFVLHTSVLTTVGADEPKANDAEAAFRAMAKKLERARTVRVKFETTYRDFDKTETARGSIVLADGDRARIDMNVTAKGKSSAVRIVADGKKRVVTGTDDAWAYLPRYQNNEVIQLLKHGGYVGWIGCGFRCGAHGLPVAPEFDTADFKELANESVDGRKTRQIRYSLAVKSGPVFSETVWIDAETNLPIKRRYGGTVEGVVFDYDERYSDFRIDADVDPAIFALPER